LGDTLVSILFLTMFCMERANGERYPLLGGTR
jgi:hypothetical protein